MQYFLRGYFNIFSNLFLFFVIDLLHSGLPENLFGAAVIELRREPIGAVVIPGIREIPEIIDN